jgi:WD40 repeat protein
VTGCTYSPDGRRVVSSSWDGTLRVWDPESGAALASLAGHTDAVTGCAHSPDGHRIVSASDDRTVKVWDAEPGRE